MSCRRFQQQLNKFIKDEIDPEELDFFISHAKNCKDCYEELEINYMVNVGLEMIENDDKASFDLAGQLKKKLSQLERKADIRYKFNTCNKIIVCTAYVCIGVSFVAGMLVYLQIL